MRKDVIDDRYGRLYELPSNLASRGHDVLGICLSYRPRAEGMLISEERLSWFSYNAMPLGLLAYPRGVLKILRTFRPEVVIGSSDLPHVILAATTARYANVPLWIDLYDNYESFSLARVPGLTALYRRAIRGTSGVTCVSSPLASYVRDQYRLQCPIITLESVIDATLFRPLDRVASRIALGLPQSARLIGTAGALDSGHGIETLYAAFAEINRRREDVHLVLAGSPSKRHPVPDSPRVHFLGMLKHQKIPGFFNALDVAIIPMRDSPFGRYAFPQKLYEIVSCRVPVVAARVGAISETLAKYPECLYRWDSPDDLAAKIIRQLDYPDPPRIQAPDWSRQASRLETELERVAGGR